MSDETVLSDEERFEALLSADSEPIEETAPVEEVGQAEEEEAEEVEGEELEEGAPLEHGTDRRIGSYAVLRELLLREDIS